MSKDNEIDLFGTDLLGEAVEAQVGKSTIHGRFTMPPFTILDARQGAWLERKRAWLGMGIQSEVGRGTNLAFRLTDTKYGERREEAKGKAILFDKSQEKLNELLGGKGFMTGTSVFDPVLCELSYKWFCPPGGTVLDPFAGGSVRGLIAAMLGRDYVGCELRAEQVEANRAQAEDVLRGDKYMKPTWLEGDSMGVAGLSAGHLPLHGADMLFTCPPYGDLEVYSDEDGDISNMSYEEFISNYRAIVARSCELLADNSFAVIVVGNYRDKKTGNYRDFVGDTVRAFTDAGLGYYNEAVLVTSIGTLALRITKQFQAGRKMGKMHQNMLVFIKGDSKVAAARQGGGDV